MKSIKTWRYVPPSFNGFQMDFMAYIRTAISRWSGLLFTRDSPFVNFVFKYLASSFDRSVIAWF